MDKLQHEFMVLAVANIVAVGMAAILFLLMIGGLLDKWFGSDSSTSVPNRHQRRIQQRRVEKEEAFQNAIAAAVAEQMQQLKNGTASAGATST